jgi:S-(hydroxymethyl)glutathione dehydrogenase/alcohol dehydrogenase
MHWRKSIGCSAKGSAYSEIGGGKINFGPVTTLSQYSVISEDRLTPLPKDFPLAVAPLLGCALLTGFGAVTREARVVPGESCLILGLGGIGISILKSLRMVSALPITVVDISTEKLELAKRLGAHEVYLIGREESSAADFLRIAGVEAPDVVFECTGKRHLIEAAISAVKPDGRVLLIGVPDSRDPAHIPTLKLHLGVTLMGSHGGLSLPHVDIPRLGALHSAGLLELTDFPISKFALEDVNSAIEMLKSGILGRAIIEMD